MAALREYVLAQVGVTDLLDESSSGPRPSTTLSASERTYVNRIPRPDIEAADTFHPPKMIVLRQAGGEGKRDDLPIEGMRVQLLCYGESDFEADKLRRAVHDALLDASRECRAGVLIHSIISNGGAFPLVDPEIVWPAVSQTYTMTADAEEAA